ncbi:universal stress protein [Maribacter sp. HTCC2170]|uniref:universal stress protein n=1 Tax=Maribacter sp. (strain HTCC2170 / KCCM 42371) TaxID=313603 RepID=UPI00006B486E|nr:universal stress protein [Maribacter sp. HTCC2170]EAR01757.1 universal stress protein [Maribacter sp. HTCC2170]
MKKILIPIDFSDFSEYALEVAAKLARKFNADLVVLHMLGLSEAVFTKDEAQEFMEAQYYMKLAKKRFDEFLDRPFLKGIRVYETVQNYKDFNEINNIVKEQFIDLVVMGSHGTSGLNELFLGSNTEKVVRTCDTPVLIIKKRRKDFNIKEAIFASDFEVENIPAYTEAMRFFDKLEANVHLVYVNRANQYFRSSEEIDKQMQLFLRTAHHSSIPEGRKVKVVNDYSVEEGIYNYAKNIDANIIALPTHGRKGLSHFFKGSIGEDIANHADLPVLTFKL